MIMQEGIWPPYCLYGILYVCISSVHIGVLPVLRGLEVRGGDPGQVTNPTERQTHLWAIFEKQVDIYHHYTPVPS